jgi:serine protease Do
MGRRQRRQGLTVIKAFAVAGPYARCTMSSFLPADIRQLAFAVPLLLACMSATAQAVPDCPTRADTAPPDFVQAVARNRPSLVHLLTVREWGETAPGDTEPVSSMAGGAAPVESRNDGPEQDGPALAERITASGFVLSSDGFILTSAHAVIERREVWAVLSDGRWLPARVVGIDRRADVALLKVAAAGLPVAPVARAPRVCAGQWVGALGAPFGFEQTLTVGVVSAEPRVLPGYGGVPQIQMNVALNPGSSGGPLFNADGEVVGLNTMIFSSAGFYLGIAFAVPIDRALQVAERLRHAHLRPPVTIAVVTQPLTPALARAFGLPNPAGVLVLSDEANPGPGGGLRRGDVVLAVDDRTVVSGEDLDDAVAGQVAGAFVRIVVWRAGQRTTLRVGLRVLPTDADAPPLDGGGGRAHRLGLLLLPPAQTASLPPGVHVQGVSGAALLAGLEPGDRIVAVNATPVATPFDFDAALAGVGLGADTVALLVVRGPMSLYVPVMRTFPPP